MRELIHWKNVKEFASEASTSMRDVITGDILRTKAAFFKKNIPLVILIVFFLFCHIGLRYNCEAKVAAITKAKNELVDVKHTALTNSAALLEMHKQSRIETEVEMKAPSLKFSQTPPIIIRK